MSLDTHDILREPGRVSVDKAELEALLVELYRERELAKERFEALVAMRLERDEARRERAIMAVHR